jgi:integrase-like protein
MARVRASRPMDTCPSEQTHRRPQGSPTVATLTSVACEGGGLGELAEALQSVGIEFPRRDREDAPILDRDGLHGAHERSAELGPVTRVHVHLPRAVDAHRRNGGQRYPDGSAAPFPAEQPGHPAWGPQYTAHAFGAELRWLGIQHLPSLVGEPQCNGVIERFMRTLKEQRLWLHRFTDLAHAEREIGAFIERYNAQWLVKRHDHCTPRAIRAKLQAAA